MLLVLNITIFWASAGWRASPSAVWCRMDSVKTMSTLILTSTTWLWRITDINFIKFLEQIWLQTPLHRFDKHTVPQLFDMRRETSKHVHLVWFNAPMLRRVRPYTFPPVERSSGCSWHRLAFPWHIAEQPVTYLQFGKKRASTVSWYHCFFILLSIDNHTHSFHLQLQNTRPQANECPNEEHYI